MLGLMKSGQSWKNMIGWIWGKCSKLENLGEALGEGFLTCFWREGKGAGHSDHASAIFSDAFSLKYWICQGAVFGGTPSNVRKENEVHADTMGVMDR